jgi:hypothetical protein
MAITLPGLEARGMIQMYEENWRVPGYLASHFKPVPGSTGSTGLTLEWDIVRYTDQIAGTVSRNSGSNENTVDKFSTKGVEPPYYAEHTTIDAGDLVNRLPGEDPYSAGNRSGTSRFQAHMTRAMQQMTALVDRSAEVQASQIMQTGVLALSGAQPFAADFFPKATHFPTAGVLWSVPATADPIGDIASLCRVINSDSRKRPKKLIFGATAWREFLATDQVQALGDLLRINVIAVAPQISGGNGENFMGTITAENFTLNMYTYDAEYEPFAGGSNVPFVDDRNVIVLPEDPAFVFGSLVIPRVLPPDPRVASLITPTTKSRMGYDIMPNVWCNDQGTVLSAGVRTALLLFPQGIDEFGTLAT